MANLTAKNAFGPLLPITHGALTLMETTPAAITWVAPYKGKLAAVSKALTKQIKAPFPDPNRVTGPAAGTGNTTARVVWTGPDQAFVLGPLLKPITGAAMGDQSSAWATCALEGDGAADVLARLVPIDLRDEKFLEGHGARTILGHMNCVVMRTGAQRFEIMVFRSMAKTAADEIAHAMRTIKARAAL